MRIWKWKLNLVNRQVVMMPAGAKMLDVQVQDDDLCIWALCDPNAVRVPVVLAIYGTGNPIPDEPGEYVATVQVLELVFHVFEEMA